MSTTHGHGYCQVCQQSRMTVRTGTNHVLHLVLSVLTLGFWLIVWLIVALINSSRTGSCTVCGTPLGKGIAMVQPQAPPAGGQLPQGYPAPPPPPPAGPPMPPMG